MKTKIFVIIILAALLTLGFFIFPKIKNKYFSGSEEPKKIINITNKSDSAPFDLSVPEQTNENADLGSSPESAALPADEKAKGTGQSSPLLNINDRGTSKEKTLAHITTEHCNNDCNSFMMDLKLLEYCQQVCGLSPVKNVSGCDGKKDMEKDYCLKDLAITKNDSSLCGQIEDANIKQACQNRFIEDILEKQK